jgi:hypothetical protein
MSDRAQYRQSTADAERGGPDADDHQTVVLLSWPAEDDRRRQLQATGSPRLLLIAPGITPPPSWDPLEDWVRVPADPEELHARASSVRRRAAAGLEPAPRVDDNDLLWHRGAWVALPTIEAAFMRLLVDRHGALVARESLVAAGWHDGISDRRALDARLKMLRRRIEPLQLVIHTVPRRGFVLESR